MDERLLMSEGAPPVDLKQFLYAQLLRCGIVQHEPFVSCCRESFVGSCAPRFLWLRLMKVCNASLDWPLQCSAYAGSYYNVRSEQVATFFAVGPMFFRGNYLGLWGTVWVSCGIMAGVDLGLWLGLVSC